MLFPKAILKAEWDAAAPLRDALTIRRERWRRLRSEKEKWRRPDRRQNRAFEWVRSRRLRKADASKRSTLLAVTHQCHRSAAANISPV
jgi:hypothetical protein